MRVDWKAVANAARAVKGGGMNGEIVAAGDAARPAARLRAARRRQEAAILTDPLPVSIALRLIDNIREAPSRDILR
jgi:hypothetical protein